MKTQSKTPNSNKAGASIRTKGIPQSKMKKVLSKLGGTEWNVLLLAQPRFADYFDWNAGLASFTDNSWNSYAKALSCFSRGVAVAIRPDLIDKISFEKHSCDCDDFLALVPDKAEEFADRFGWWADMGGDSWQQVLSAQPRFANRCKWGRLGGNNWASLLRVQPQFADKCVWSKLEGDDWVHLLEKQPQFEDKCDKWDKIVTDSNPTLQMLLFGHCTGDWVSLLSAQPHLFDKCDRTKLKDNDWYRLLWARPEFADKCELLHDKTVDLMEGLRVRLGMRSEQSADWSKLNGEDWSRLLAERPEFADKCDWSKLRGPDWARLLRIKPQFSDKCDWSKLGNFSYPGIVKRSPDWGELLSIQPQFADKCDWKLLDASERLRILCAQPDLAEYFAERLSAKK